MWLHKISTNRLKIEQKFLFPVDLIDLILLWVFFSVLGKYSPICVFSRGFWIAVSFCCFFNCKKNQMLDCKMMQETVHILIGCFHYRLDMPANHGLNKIKIILTRHLKPREQQHMRAPCCNPNWVSKINTHLSKNDPKPFKTREINTYNQSTIALIWDYCLPEIM